MQKCLSCKEQFSWSKIYKSFWWIIKPITCKACGREHAITITGRIIFGSLTIFPAAFFSNLLSPSNVLIMLVIAALIFIVDSLLTPFFVRYE